MGRELQIQLCTTLDLRKTLKITVDHGAANLPATACSVRLVEGKYLSVGAATGFQNTTGREHRVLIDPFVAPVIEQHEVLRITDLDTLDNGSRASSYRMDTEHLRAYLGVPIIIDGSCIGLLSFYQEQPHRWTDTEVSRALSISQQVALGIHNARQYQEAYEKAERLEVLQNIVQALNSARTPDKMFQVIAVQTSRIVLNDRISIALYDPGSDAFSLSVVAITKGITNLTSGTSIAAQDTDIASVVRTHQPLLLDDISSSTKSMTTHLYYEGIRSIASVPIISESECIGCLNVGSREVAAFSPVHLEVLSTIAAHLAIAIRNTRLYNAIRESQEYTSQIIQTTPDAIIAADREHRLREFNDAAEIMFGHSRKGVLGARITDFFPIESRCEIEQLLEQVLSGQSLPPHETYLLDQEGVPIPVRLVLAPHSDANGQVRGSVGILRDLSKERSLEERLSYSERLRMLGELASGVAHNLNNSLFPITTYAQDLRERASNEEDRELLDLIIKAAWNCANTVKRIQSFTATQVDMEFYRVDMAEVVNDALEFTRSRWSSEAQAQGINIQVTLDHQSVSPVNGSEGELKEVLANLIFNAVDAMWSDGGHLHIGLSDDGESVHVIVQDTGLGMTEEVRKAAFNPFYTTKGAEGTGLGLRTAYNIISRHHGSIEIVETIPGQGTTFRVSLPIDLDASKPEQEERILSEPANILVVDDNPEVCELIAMNLENDGHKVFRALRGEEALKVFKEDRPDIVFTDLSMPDMSGWQLAREIKQIAPNVGVALITGWGAQRLDQRDIEGSGIDLVLGKPLRDYQILNAVARLRRS